MPHETHVQSTLVKSLFILLATSLAVACGYAIRHTVACFLSSFVIAYLLDPFLVILERRGMKRIYGIAVLYVILAVVSLFALVYLVPLIASRWESLLHNLPEYFRKAREMAAGLQNRIYAAPGANEWDWLLDSAALNIEAITSRIGTGVYSTASNMAFNLLNLILAPILVFFMLLYKHECINAIKIWLPSRQREHLLEIGCEINASIGGYLRGQLIVSFIVAVFSTIALLLLKIDYPLLNGIFAGLASILPFIGVILATLPPLFFAYIKFQSGAALLQVTGAFAVIYFLEGYLIKPLVFKESMNLNPLLTIIVVMAFGEMMGFWGIMLAVPIAAAIKIVTTHWRRGEFQEGA